MRDALDAARALLPGVTLRDAQQLHDSERSTVWRVRARWPDVDETTVIVKRFASADDEWFMREAAALAVCPAHAPTAQIVVENSDPPLVVMTDLGTGPSVADALRGADPQVAAEAVRQWAVAMGRLHRSTLSRRERFRAALGQRCGELLLGESRMSLAADEAAHLLDRHCVALDVTVPPHGLQELRELPRLLSADGAAAISPDDACPEDNVWVGDRLILVDFEGAQWRHVAWDVAYLTVPWPSCRCSWRMPSDVAARALESYRAELEDELPYVREAQFRTDVSAAALGWSLISTAWYLASALTNEPPDPATPSRRALILHRLDGARRAAALPAAAELADRLRTELVSRWGEVPLGYAPAFDEDLRAGQLGIS
jgi:hypothetical protein